MGLLSKASFKTSAAASQELPAETEPAAVSSTSIKAAKAALIQYQKQNPLFSCIVIDFPGKSSGAAKNEFAGKLAQMTRLAGITSALPNGRSIVLLPAGIDRDLIAHRLSASLKTKTLAAVSADNPDNALSEIRPYL